ncbi:glycine betaine ABC transporter substrate-binding protein [Candidimonas nitroreducens]|uniref:glycine betaine ABC transporter substrate-binding protein n=1 Tax=Candidimonas nitroreducens TaxID=683354 RepID=UPI001E2EBB12|nr:glycine betaine ABC transporter substrate-binding protein [Candidimonas nitroreducens]
MGRILVCMGLWLACLLQMGCARAQAAPCNDGQPVRFAQQGWESADFTTNVLQEILRKAYGCKTETVPGTPAATETALTQDDLQVIAEQWSGRSAIIEGGVKAGTVRLVGDTLKGGAQQGWYVPDYVVHGDAARGIRAQAPDLSDWNSLARYAPLFKDPEVPGKGRFLNCPTGWTCEQFNSRYLRLFGLGRYYTNFRAGTGAALDSAISSAYDRGKPILFYYWQPTALMAKYKFYRIGMPPFNQACWDAMISGKGRLCPTDFLTAHLGIAVSAPFARRNPQLMSLFARVQFEPALLDNMIYTMSRSHEPGERAADGFLRTHREVWTSWLPADRARRLELALGLAHAADSAAAGQGDSGAKASRPSVGRPDAGRPGEGRSIFPALSFGDYVNRHLTAVVKEYGAGLHAASDAVLAWVLLPVERLLLRLPPEVLLLVIALLAWRASRGWVLPLCCVAGLYAVGALGLWTELVQTFSLVLVATVCAVLLGVPAGILAARHPWLGRLLAPVLDVMQTLPSFVYLVPVLMLFGLGMVPALLATVVYALPPLIRLTALGLRQVDGETVEAAQSFGLTRWQMLTRVMLPLARPSIMAGVNQATMMALAMVVVASMIGARGLGEDVLAGIQTLDVGRGLQAGLAIVVLAIVIDRITQAYGRSQRGRRAAEQGGRHD